MVSDDIEFTKCQTNDTPRRDLPFSPTPDWLFEHRDPITDGDRDEFLKSYYERESKARRELGFLDGIELSLQQQTRVDRIALSAALLEKGYLQFQGEATYSIHFGPKTGKNLAGVRPGVVKCLTRLCPRSARRLLSARKGIGKEDP